ncbi:MAG: hypothetical protein WCH37_12685, partial [Synechococcaceae cyanobacterium ELA182]
RDLLTGADGIQQGRQMGLGLEGTDAAHGSSFNQSRTSLSGPHQSRSPISAFACRPSRPICWSRLKAQESPSTAQAGQAGLLLEQAIESRIVP